MHPNASDSHGWARLEGRVVSHVGGSVEPSAAASSQEHTSRKLDLKPRCQDPHQARRDGKLASQATLQPLRKPTRTSSALPGRLPQEQGLTGNLSTIPKVREKSKGGMVQVSSK